MRAMRRAFLARPSQSIAYFMSLSFTGGMAYQMSGSSSVCASNKPSVRVATYNLLTSHYADPREMKRCDPADLLASTRVQRLQAKLQSETKQDAIIGIQELSQTFATTLLPFFFRENYHVITANYGHKSSDYMGVALAWPANLYEALETRVEKVSDVGKWPQTKRQTTLGWILSLPSLFLNLFRTRKESFDPWQSARGRFNQIAMVRLKDRATGATFWVASYHMPCLFGTAEKRQTMVMHAYLALKTLQSKADRTGDPYVLMGDFNFQPGQSSYKLITEGKLDSLDEDFPKLPASANDELRQLWAMKDIRPMQSAYNVVNGREPEFTNHAWQHRVDSKQSEDSVQSFTETLDYIFLSENWKAESVLPLPTRESLGNIKSFPTAAEPSDHIMLGARISL